MKILTVDGLQQLISRVSIDAFFDLTRDRLEQDFGRWHHFQKSPRHAVHYPYGVIELMPCADDEFYAFKYVNGHPYNTQQGRLCVIGLGLLADAKSGYPLLFSEMTLLTAIRTAAVAALGAKYLARADCQHLAVIGNGAQSEFQVTMLRRQLPLTTVSFFDPDGRAMEKFANNLGSADLSLKACDSIQDAVSGADLIVTATAAKQANDLIEPEWLAPGVHIHAMGGDCPGKTELGQRLLGQSKIVVEYLPQSLLEGEMQNMTPDNLYGELWQLVDGSLPGRENDTEITLFDSVGFALEDYSILRLVLELLESADYADLCLTQPMVPPLADPKNLYGLLSG